MRKHPENFTNKEPEKKTSEVLDLGLTSTKMRVLSVWLKNVREIPEGERENLTISLIKNREGEKDPTTYHVTLNEQDQLVASDGKNGFLLVDKTWEVPNSTLEVLNKPLPTKK